MPSKLRLWIAAVVVVLGVMFLVVTTWVVPWVIEAQVNALYAGKVQVGGWWADRSSSGVENLRFYEGNSPSSPILARVDRVETDLTLGRLVFGPRSPKQIKLIRPALTFRIGKDGKPVTDPPLKNSGPKKSGAPEPRIVVEDATITIQQAGRQEMVLSGVSGQLFEQDGKQVVDFGVDDPTWGKWSAAGKLGGDFQSGQVRLKSLAPIEVTAEKTARLPFIPPEVWANVAPRGPVGVELTISPGKTLGLVTTLDFVNDDVALPNLGMAVTDAHGRVVVDGGIVRLQGLEARSLDGGVGVNGTLDFTQVPPRFVVDLKLDKVDVTKTPPNWQLAEAGVTGRLTGAARLKIAIKGDAADLTGSEGEGVIEGGTIGGIADKSLKLGMKAQEGDLQYETKGSGGATLRPSVKALAVLPLVALQEPPKPKPKTGGLILPKFLNTEIELEDVDLVQVVAKANALGIRIPVPMAGKLSIKAKAKIPLGAIRDVKAYAFHGEATLKSAVIDGVDLGLLRARLDLENGVLDLSDFQGRLLDRPAGSTTNPAPAAASVAADAPLPSGAFRGRLHAEISPPGQLEAHFEGNTLPVGELAAPFFPKPTPVSGQVSLEVMAKADVSKLDDPSGWDVSGTLNGSRIAYRGSILNAVSASFAVRQSRLKVPDLTAKLEGQPLGGSIDAALAAPYDFQARLDTTDWDLGALLALIPPVPKPAPVAGKLTIHAKASGTLSPQHITSEGEGKVVGFRGGPVPLGDVPVRWATEGDAIVISGVEAQPFGGKITAHASIPVKGDRPITASLQVRGVDTAMLSAAVPNDSLQLAGNADGDATLTIRPLSDGKAPVVQASLRLDSPELTIQGLPAKELQAAITVENGAIRFDVFAKSLGGKVKFTGDIPLGASGAVKPEANATFKAIGFRIEEMWHLLGIRGSSVRLQGEGAVDVNLRTHLQPIDLRARGIAEFRDVRWGPRVPLGDLKGIFTITPDGMTISPLTGDLFDGRINGSVTASMELPRRMQFDVAAERISLRKALAFMPNLAKHIDGVSTVRLAGRAGNGFRADGEASVNSARLFGFPLNDLRVPVSLELTPGGEGNLSLHRWTTRIAGGRLTGDARLGLGLSRSFQVDAQLVGIDLETMFRILSDAKKPTAGKVSGKISVGSGDAADLRRYRGRVDLNLDDASLVEVPIFRELDRFLGGARGGIFDDGDLHAAIAGSQLVVESFTLTGPLVQLHGSGTVGLDSRVDLEVLVNTTQIVSQTGEALVALIPGSGGTGGRVGRTRFAGFLSSRLLKFRVSGTLANPSVNLDPTIAVSENAAGFFAGVLKLPLELLR